MFQIQEQKKYNIIYADPPWPYNIRNRDNKTKFGGGASGQYKLLTFPEIYNLNISSIAAQNCALFLWCTFPKLPQQIKTIEAWGFTFKTVGFNWVKTNKNNSKPFFGVGYYTKSNSEVCLLGIKGKMKPVSNKVSSIIISPRRKHSQKPDEVRDRIVELFGDLPRVELFARQKTEGWSVWGNEIDSNINIK